MILLQLEHTTTLLEHAISRQCMTRRQRDCLVVEQADIKRTTRHTAVRAAVRQGNTGLVLIHNLMEGQVPEHYCIDIRFLRAYFAARYRLASRQDATTITPCCRMERHSLWAGRLTLVSTQTQSFELRRTKACVKHNQLITYLQTRSTLLRPYTIYPVRRTGNTS